MLLHSQTALFFKRLLLFERACVVTSVPFTSVGRERHPSRRSNGADSARGPAVPDRAPTGAR